MARGIIGGLEVIPAVLTVILVVSPWALGSITVTSLAWHVWIIAILVVLRVESRFAMQIRRATA